MVARKPGIAVLVENSLPAEQLLDRQVVAQARLLQADQAKANGLDDDLAPRGPAFGVGGEVRSSRQRGSPCRTRWGVVGRARLVIPANELIIW